MTSLSSELKALGPWKNGENFLVFLFRVASTRSYFFCKGKIVIFCNNKSK